MFTYTFMNDHGLAPQDAEAALEGIGLSGLALQILHYERPRVVYVFAEREWTEAEQSAAAQAIAAIQGVDPVAPGG